MGASSPQGYDLRGELRPASPVWGPLCPEMLLEQLFGNAFGKTGRGILHVAVHLPWHTPIAAPHAAALRYTRRAPGAGRADCLELLQRIARVPGL